MKRVNAVGFGFALAISLQAQADIRAKFAVPLSASLGLGAMENSDMNLKSRVMNALSLEALPSYRMGKWLIGPHLDYRIQGQITSLDSAGGTNLKGSGYLIGLGARYELSDRHFAQASLDLIGEYDFEKNSSIDQDDKAVSPLGLRLKSGYAFFEKIPNLTFDADVQYLTFKKIHIAGTDTNATTNQFMVSIGITYQFGKDSSPASEVQVEPTSSPTPEPEKPNASLEQIEGVQKSGDSLALNISGTNFGPGSAELSEDAKKRFVEAANVIAQNPNVNVRIEGHSDTSGNAKKNEALSQARAESVKSYLIENGVNSERITAQGFGSSKPVADNKTKEGRIQNRRVEIYFDSKDEN